MLTIKIIWTKKTINLSNTILQIIRHIEINKKNEKDMAKKIKILVTKISQALKRMCTT